MSYLDYRIRHSADLCKRLSEFQKLAESDYDDFTRTGIMYYFHSYCAFRGSIELTMKQLNELGKVWDHDVLKIVNKKII